MFLKLVTGKFRKNITGFIVVIKENKDKANIVNFLINPKCQNRGYGTLLLQKAIEYLKTLGCEEIILFGSLADGTFNEFSDIDLAISGIPPRNFFKAVAELPSILDHKVDLIPLDYISVDFAKKIRERGEIVFAA